jgi:asparagine synthase (glutamine-hydrolysing)
LGAIFGIYGECNKSELEQIGVSLGHRGEIGSSWTVNPIMHFGQRTSGPFDNEFSPQNYPITFDGMIDIPKEIISDLKCENRGNTIAKIIFELYRKMGPKGFQYIRAPFAIALWDARKETLILVSDPLGIKMLYYTSDSCGRYIFASEYKALLALDTFLAAPDRDAIQYVHRTKYAMPGRSCLAGVKCVLKGSWVEINKAGTCSERYSNINVNITKRSKEEHAKILRDNLLKATNRITSQFGKIGIALSGGVDSVAVTAAARIDAPEKEIHSFTVGIDASDNSVLEAKRVAEYFKTIHHEIIIEENNLPELMKNALWHMEEPTGREERIMKYCIASEAVKHIPIILTGDQADSLFGGMPKHLIANIAFRLPIFRKPLSDFYNYTQMGTIPRSIFGKALITSYFKGTILPESNVIGAQWNPPKSSLLRASYQPLNEYLKKGLNYGGNHYYAYDKIFNGRCILVISPFWDFDIIRSAFQIPDRFKIKGIKQKYILKRALAELLPDHLMNRKKDFMRIINDLAFCDCLENIANHILSDNVVKERGFFESKYVSRLKFRPRKGLYAMEEFYNLWSLILIEMWCRIFIDNRGINDITI